MIRIELSLRNILVIVGVLLGLWLLVQLGELTPIERLDAPSEIRLAPVLSDAGGVRL